MPERVGPDYIVTDEVVHMSEDDLAAVAAIRPLARTIVLACDKPMAVEWCNANGVAPYAKTTFLLGAGGRGLQVRNEDRVVFVGDVERRPDWANVWGAFAPMLHLVGLDKIERVPEAA